MIGPPIIQKEPGPREAVFIGPDGCWAKLSNDTDLALNLCLPPQTAQRVFQFSSVQSLSCIWLFATPWTAAHQASLPITNSQSPPKPMSIESVMSSNHLILCRPRLLLPPVFPSIRVFSNESTLKSIGVRLPHQSFQWTPRTDPL